MAPGAATIRAERVASRPMVRNTWVVAYIALTLLALVPGLLLRAGIDPADAGAAADALRALQHGLDEIKFGDGIRFWLGVAGATMMGLLLLYPLRKALATRSGLGTVGAWFHLHILFGLIGPALILYHCNFGLGSANANVALWSMLIVVVSGIAGHFVYTRVSADFYAGKQAARTHIDAIAATYARLDALHTARARLVEELESVEADLLTPRQGVISSLRARLRIESRRREISEAAGWLLAECARELALTPRDHTLMRGEVARHLKSYFRIARHASSRSVLEQVWARWRLFHLPVFLIMTVATALHVIAVWDMDGPRPAGDEPVIEAAADAASLQQAARASVETGAPLRTTAEVLGAASIAQTRVQVVDIRPPLDRTQSGGSAGGKPPGDGNGRGPDAIAEMIATMPEDSAAERPSPAGEIAGPKAPPQLVAKPQAANRRTATVQDAYVPPKTRLAEDRSPAANPEPGQPATGSGAPTRTGETEQAPAAVASKPEPVKIAKAGPEPKPAVAAAPGPAPGPTAAPDKDIKAVYSELTQRTQEAPMALGGAKPRTLAEQIAELKARQKNKEFSHSDAETGFALTGKHQRVECADCHKKPLREARQPNPRQCIACHKKDDIHRGKRPDCAQCHTTNRWSQIVRRR